MAKLMRRITQARQPGSIKTNSRMRRLLGSKSMTETAIALPSGLRKLLQKGFHEFDGVILPKGMTQKPEGHYDETGSECFENKIHLEDFVAKKVSVKQLVQIGLAWTAELRHTLGKQNIDGPI